MKQNLCRFNKYGYCKFGDKCHFRHNNVICVTKKCSVFDCDKRHPVVCKYFMNFRRCKYPNCAFKHENVNEVNDSDDKIKMIESKLNGMLSAEKNKNIEKKLEAFENNYESKIEALENQLKQMNKAVEERDALVSSFRKLFEEINIKLEKQHEENKVLKEKLKSLDTTSNKLEVKFQCNLCEFKGNTQQGLKVHMKRKHTKYTEENRPNKCDICNEKYVDILGEPWDNERIEKHNLSHSYKSSSNLNYKCDECEFWGPNTLTMEVHAKRVHCEKITCGLCDYEASDVENMDTHQFTCETFKCSECKEIFRSFTEIKQHINQEHKGKHVWVDHSKSSRRNSEFYDSTSYSRKELLNKK